MDFCYKFVHSLLSMSIPKDVWLDVITDCETETSSRYVAGFPPKTDHLQFFTNLYRWEVALRVASQQLTFILAFLSWDCLVTALFLQPLQFNLHPGKFGVYFITEFLQWLFYALYRLKCKLLFARLNLVLFSRKRDQNGTSSMFFIISIKLGPRSKGNYIWDKISGECMIEKRVKSKEICKTSKHSKQPAKYL